MCSNSIGTSCVTKFLLVESSQPRSVVVSTSAWKAKGLGFDSRAGQTLFDWIWLFIAPGAVVEKFVDAWLRPEDHQLRLENFSLPFLTNGALEPRSFLSAQTTIHSFEQTLVKKDFESLCQYFGLFDLFQDYRDSHYNYDIDNTQNISEKKLNIHIQTTNPRQI